MRCRVRAAASLFWGGGRRLGSYHSQRLLGAKGAEKCHPKNSDGSAAIDVLNVSFWVYSSVLVLFGIYLVADVTAVLFCVTHSESTRGTTWVMRVMGKAGHLLQQGRSTNLYLAHQQHQHQHQQHLSLIHI